MSDEVLHGGLLNDGRIVRRGDTVIRRQGHRWPEAVGEALAVLRSRGFKACPQQLERVDDMTVVLSFVAGEALSDPVPPWASSLTVLDRVTWMMRAMSDAGADIADELEHCDWFTEPVHDRTALLHGDPHPTNLIFDRRQRPIGIVDFELATLGSPELNLISLIFHWAPLEPFATTCWRGSALSPVSERIARMLHAWPSSATPAELIELGDVYFDWRRRWMQQLADLGNRPAQRLMSNGDLAERLDYARALLAEIVEGWASHCP